MAIEIVSLPLKMMDLSIVMLNYQKVLSTRPVPNRPHCAIEMGAARIYSHGLEKWAGCRCSGLKAYKIRRHAKQIWF